uniref:Uncharacterized protein n=1 Tax=Branchiostoma floridae TaxID=7739 RepID=C3YSU3_BRAFL|eukprot:XP_002600595.1 hypothetical protein BRAFLDRAFT_101626 [Branchiostoma floridae]
MSTLELTRLTAQGSDSEHILQEQKDILSSVDPAHWELLIRLYCRPGAGIYHSSLDWDYTGQGPSIYLKRDYEQGQHSCHQDALRSAGTLHFMSHGGGCIRLHGNRVTEEAAFVSMETESQRRLHPSP